VGNLVVVGAGICGLGTALLLARDGHRVTVLEKDSAPVPESLDECWEGWVRKGVAQFRQPHNFMPGLRAILEADLPDVQDDLIKAGACRFDMLNPIPPRLRDSPSQPIDDKLWTWTCRRPTGEWVFLKAAERDPHIEVRRGTAVESLVTGTPARDGTPHVGGVRTAGGEEIQADLVIDATGRGSRAPEWLRTAGVSVPPDQAVDCNFTYLTRHFTGDEPERAAPPLTEMGSISILTLMADRDTWSVTVFISSRDRELKGLRNAAAWTKVVRACPLHAHWLEGDPISDVLPMSGVVDRYRRFAGEAGPPVSGIVTVADAWACTNPSAGRGITVGMLHARLLRDSIRRFEDDPWKLVADFDERTEVEIRPWYGEQIAVDRARFAAMEACRTGEAPAAPSDPLTRDVTLLRKAMFGDGALFRLGLEYIATLATAQEIMNRPGVRRRFEEAAVELRKNGPPPMPGPSREQLIELVA
jgi:2-polyprenyl-6-methoxyphenol hydroxylase-like FAD-dependent oxidoreductase